MDSREEVTKESILEAAVMKVTGQKSLTRKWIEGTLARGEADLEECSESEVKRKWDAYQDARKAVMRYERANGGWGLDRHSLKEQEMYAWRDWAEVNGTRIAALAARGTLEWILKGK